MRAYRERRVKITPRPFYHPEISQLHIEQEAGWAQEPVIRVFSRKEREIETRTSIPQRGAILTALSRIPLDIDIDIDILFMFHKATVKNKQGTEHVKSNTLRKIIIL